MGIAGADVTRSFTDAFCQEDDLLLAARDQANEWGAEPVAPSVGATLQVLCTIANARNIVEVGTGVGVSALYLLRGATPVSVLTTIDIDQDRQDAARELVADGGFGAGRVRFMTGQALDVLPRLADHGYDLFFLDAPPDQVVNHLDQAIRLLRPGGVLCVNNALAGGLVVDPTRRDDDTAAIRGALRWVQDDPRLLPTLLPVADGLLVATKTSAPDDEHTPVSRQSRATVGVQQRSFS